MAPSSAMHGDVGQLLDHCQMWQVSIHLEQTLILSDELEILQLLPVHRIWCHLLYDLLVIVQIVLY